MSAQMNSIDGVVDVEVLRGADAPPNATPSLLVEVPHGADERAHYNALLAQLQGPFPDALDAFFSINTDVGAWAYGRATALEVLRQRPQHSALLVRSLIPRTFIDCNRPPTGTDGALSEGALTPGIPPYVRDPRDLSLLTERHAAYVDVVERAYAQVCGGGGYALVPHSYGPRSLGIERVDDDIVRKLRWACAPERVETWPLRAEVDLLTRDGDGAVLAPPGVEEQLLRAFSQAGFAPKANDTYYVHPASLAHTWSTAHPGRLVCLEVRRDLLVERWEPFEEMRADPEKVARVARVLAPELVSLLDARG